MSARNWAVAVMLALGLTLASGTAGAASGGRKPKVSGVVNLNQATVEQLSMLPGIGTKAALAIVAFRDKHHFTRIEELVKVKGFGKKRFSKLKQYLAVSGNTTLKALEKPKPDEGEADEGGKGEEAASAETH